MKKLTLTMCLFIMTAWAVIAQRGLDKVSLTPIQLPNVLGMPGPLPEFVKQKYPDFVIAESYKIVSRGSGIITYEAKLTRGGDTKRTLLYDQNGTYYKYGVDKVSLTPIQLPNVMNLPAPLPDFLRQNYPDFVVNEAFQVVTADNVITYELGISKGTTKETLIFDQNGQLIKKNAGQMQRKSDVSRVKR